MRLHSYRSYQVQWMKKIVGAIQKGHTVIVENCPEDIDAALNPVLQVKNLSPHPGVIVPVYCLPTFKGRVLGTLDFSGWVVLELEARKRREVSCNLG